MSASQMIKTDNPEPNNATAKQLFDMTWPMLMGVLSLMSFQLVDSAFIGQLGVLPLAAQGFTMPMQMVFVGVQVGLGIATAAIISRALGEGKYQYAKQLAGLILVLGCVAVLFIGALIYAFRHPILSELGATPQVLAVIDIYWPLWLLSIFAGALLYFANSICRANGNTLIPGIMMMLTSGINIVLDPIFIFQFKLGIQGAALASFIAFSVGMAFVFYKIIKQKWMSFDWRDLQISKDLMSIGNIMGPAMISQLLPPVSSMFATKLVASYGAATIASWAIGSRYEFFAIVAVLALTMSLPPMIGQLLGRQQIQSIHRLVKMACGFVLVSQLIIAILSYFLSTPLSNLMTSDAEVSRILNMHLTWVPISLGALGICMIMVSVSNALAKPYIALLISGLRLFVFFLPCLWIGTQIWGLQGLFIGSLIGNIGAGLSAWIFYQRMIRRLQNNNSQA